MEFSLSQITFLHNLMDSVQTRLRHRPKLTFLEWAPKYIENPDGTPFQFRPVQRELAKDIFNPRLTSICFRAYSGAGKTYLMGAAFCYAIEQLRLATAAMLPKQAASEQWVKEELSKMFEATPAMDRLTMTTDIMSRKVWKEGGELHALGSNSASQLRRLQASFLYADEIDAIEQTSTDEGCKLKQFYKRGRGRKEVYKIATSYPSLKGHSKIDAMFDLSDGCRWYVICPRCEHQYEMHTRQMIWTPGKPETARIACPECGTKHDDETRREMAENGVRLNRQKQPPSDSGARGFHVNCMAHTGNFDSAYDGYLHEVAADIESNKKADNPEKARRVFVNTMDAESFQAAVESKPEADTLYDRREPYRPKESLPAGVLVLTMGVDVQKDRLECFVLGSGLNAETWGIDYRVIPGSIQSPSTHKKLDAYIDEEWRHPFGQKLKVVQVFVDSGKWQDAVFDYTRPRIRRRIFACKGAKMIDRPFMDNKPSRIGRPVTLQYHIGTHAAKDIIYQRLDLEPIPGSSEFPRGFIHFPEIDEFGPHAGGEGTGYFEMLTAEDSSFKRSTSTGEFVRVFENPNNQRNEAIDCFVYALAAERNLNPQYERIAEKMG